MTKLSLFLFLLAFGSSTCFADDLEARLNKARSDKAVAEQATGYLKALNAETESLVSEVNKKRKEKYAATAAQTKGATLEVVEQAAGAKLMEKYK